MSASISCFILLTQDVKKRPDVMKHTAWTTWLCALLALLIGGLLTAVTEQAIQQQKEKALVHGVEVRLQQAGRQLERNLNAILALNHLLAKEIMLDGGLDTEKLQQLSEGMVSQHPSISSITLSSGLVVDFIHPLEGNEAVLGMNYRFRPDVMVGVKRAMATRDTVVAGPLKLVQNGRLGLIGRTPIFLSSPLDGAEEFLGLISIAIDLRSSLEDAGFMDSNLPFRFAIRGSEEQGAEGELFYGHIELFKQPHLSVDIHLPSGQWRIAAAPILDTKNGAGWQWLVRCVGGLLSIALALMILTCGLSCIGLRTAPLSAEGPFSLRTFLMFLLLLVLLPIVAASGYLSYRNALQLAEHYTQQLAAEIGSRVYDRIVSFFDVPRRVLAFNVEQANAGLLPYTQRSLLMQSFLLQMRQQPLLTFISMGMADGEYYAGSRPPLGSDKGLRMLQARAAEGYGMHIYRVDDANRQGSLVSRGALHFDARTRPWFAAALATGSMGWYPAYQYAVNDVDGAYGTMGLGMSAPIYDDQGVFLGVITADLALSQLNEFLAELTSASGGLAFITEANGELLAASSPEPIYQLKADRNALRIKAADSANPIIRAAGDAISQRNWPEGSASLEVKNRRYRLDWRKYTLLQGPVLTISVLQPEARFSSPMRNVLYNSIALALAVLLVCVIVGVFATGWVAKPLAALSQWAARLAGGDWTAIAPKATPVQEIISLSATLDDMSSQLKRNTEELELRILQRTADLEAVNHQLAELSVTDGLTGLANRRRFDAALADEWARARRTRQPLAVIMMDVDYFKKYNDCYGHLAGDACLKAVAGVLQRYARRAGDLAARYGGEEFVVVAANTDQKAAYTLAETLRNAVVALAIPHETSPFGMVSVSAGVAVRFPTPQSSEHELLHAADEALYRAKDSGRNRVL